MGKRIEEEINGIVKNILSDYQKNRAIDKANIYNQPDREEILDMVQKLQYILYPGFFKDKVYKIYSIENHVSTVIEDVMFHLNKQITIVLKYCEKYPDKTDEELEEMAQEISVKFLNTIPLIREYLDTDLQAAVDGDPAASSKDEVIFSYPGFYAITVYRLAHELFKLSVPMIPRIMTEHAHNVTGIDIHPGATIGKYFFIDHGTGIVIGETTTIGDNVKIYQGVTLGALSTKEGQKLRGTKRHPTIGDNVTIYSGASILGGDTVIEENVVVGGNAFITKSIKEGTRVSVKNQELQMKRNGKMVAADDDENWFYII
ncbi:MAG: serine O-acetyltransferase EpsC [Lachnospiraceae bacterium]